jgi:hypothetical protein
MGQALADREYMEVEERGLASLPDTFFLGRASIHFPSFLTRRLRRRKRKKSFSGTPQYGSNKTKGQKRDTEADTMAY